MQVYPNQFGQEISRGLKPCYLVFGDEPQQKFDVIEQIRQTAKQQGFIERTVLVADTGFSWNQVLEATQSMSLFSSQQELIYTVRYKVQFPDQEAILATFDVIRDYQDDPDHVLAKSRELDIVLDEMRNEAADIIIRRLSSQATMTYQGQ